MSLTKAHSDACSQDGNGEDTCLRHSFIFVVETSDAVRHLSISFSCCCPGLTDRMWQDPTIKQPGKYACIVMDIIFRKPVFVIEVQKAMKISS